MITYNNTNLETMAFEDAMNMEDDFQSKGKLFSLLGSMGHDDCIDYFENRRQQFVKQHGSLGGLQGEEYSMLMKQRRRMFFNDYCKEKGILPYALVLK